MKPFKESILGKYFSNKTSSLQNKKSEIYYIQHVHLANVYKHAHKWRSS